jgi:hypothetical protein
MGVGLGLIGVLVGLLAAQGAQKLFGWHLAGSWSGIAVLAGSTSAATVLLAVARSAPAATTPTPPEPSTVSPAPQPPGHAGDRGTGDPRPR